MQLVAEESQRAAVHVRAQASTAQLRCAAVEDVWHAYHLVREGDQVTATTFRKVVRESATSDNKESEKVKIKITITVESIDFDPDGVPWPLCHSADCRGAAALLCAVPDIDTSPCVQAWRSG